jgi:hypothetical protein
MWPARGQRSGSGNLRLQGEGCACLPWVGSVYHLSALGSGWDRQGWFPQCTFVQTGGNIPKLKCDCSLWHMTFPLLLVHKQNSISPLSSLHLTECYCGECVLLYLLASVRPPLWTVQVQYFLIFLLSSLFLQIKPVINCSCHFLVFWWY